jgi:hypothetical protein
MDVGRLDSSTEFCLRTGNDALVLRLFLIGNDGTIYTLASWRSCSSDVSDATAREPNPETIA